eukprot:3212380-Pleurochrysis_carterae.AAC.1
MPNLARNIPVLLLVVGPASAPSLSWPWRVAHLCAWPPPRDTPANVRSLYHVPPRTAHTSVLAR